MHKECGACHIAYLPKFLPATAWTRLFDTLDNHYGEDAAMNPDIKKIVREYYLKYAAGFVYFVSVLGITGTKSATEEAVAMHVQRIKRHTKLPVAVGFGIRTPEQAAAVARHADAAVVGTAIVERVKAGLDADGKAKPGLPAGVFADVKALADGVRRVIKE